MCMSFCELLAVQRFPFANFEIGAIKLCKRDLVLALLSTGSSRAGPRFKVSL